MLGKTAKIQTYEIKVLVCASFGAAVCSGIL